MNIPVLEWFVVGIGLLLLILSMIFYEDRNPEMKKHVYDGFQEYNPGDFIFIEEITVGMLIGGITHDKVVEIIHIDIHSRDILCKYKDKFGKVETNYFNKGHQLWIASSFLDKGNRPKRKEGRLYRQIRSTMLENPSSQNMKALHATDDLLKNLTPDSTEIFHSILEERVSYGSASSEIGESEMKFQYGVKALKNGNIRKAEFALKEAINFDPLNTQALFELGLIFSDESRHDEAKKVWEQILEINPEDWKTLTNLGTTLDMLGLKNEALTVYRKSIAIEPNDYMVYNNLGSLLKSLGELEVAEECLLKSIELSPLYESALDNIVSLYLEQNMDSKAERLMRETIELHPSAYYPKKLLGIILNHIGKSEDGELHLRQMLMNDPEDAEALYELARSLLMSGKFSESEATFLRVIKMNPNDAGVWTDLGVLYKSTQNYAKAEDAYRRAISLDNKHAEAWQNLGALFGTRNLDVEAEKIYREALSINPEFAITWYSLGNIQYRSKRYQEAKKSYETAISFDPSYFHSWFKLGEVCVDLKILETAESAFKRCIEMDPNIPEPYVRLGVINFIKQKFQIAINYIDEALQIGPPNWPNRQPALATRQMILNFTQK